jgi:hypothetical protein
MEVPGMFNIAGAGGGQQGGEVLAGVQNDPTETVWNLATSLRNMQYALPAGNEQVLAVFAQNLKALLGVLANATAEEGGVVRIAIGANVLAPTMCLLIGIFAAYGWGAGPQEAVLY